MGVAERADTREVALVRQHDRKVLDDRLHDERGDLLAVRLEGGLEVLEVVVGDDIDRAGLDIEGDIGRGVVGRTDVREGRLDRHLQGVVTTVVAAFDLDDRLALRVGASGAHGIHEAFRAALGEAQHVQLEAVLEELGHLGGGG